MLLRYRLRLRRHNDFQLLSAEASHLVVVFCRVFAIDVMLFEEITELAALRGWIDLSLRDVASPSIDEHLPHARLDCSKGSEKQRCGWLAL